MFQSLKNSKRRTFQKIASINNSKDSLADPKFDEAVKNFHSLEKQYQQVLAKLKEYTKIIEKDSQIRASLSFRLNTFYEEAPENQKLLARGVAVAYKKYVHAVEPTCASLLAEQAIGELTNILKTTFPPRKKLIAEHQHLQLDVESYKRRVRSLASKQGNDAKLLKFSAKLETAESRFNEKHQELLDDLVSLYDARFARLEPILCVFIACEHELSRFKEDTIGTVSAQYPSEKLNLYRSQLTDMINHGGPPTPSKTAGGGAGLHLFGSRHSTEEPMDSGDDTFRNMASQEANGNTQATATVVRLDSTGEANTVMAERVESNLEVNTTHAKTLDDEDNDDFSRTSPVPDYGARSPSSTDGGDSEGKTDGNNEDDASDEDSNNEYDEALEESPASSVPLEKCVAAYPFEGTDPDDLSFKKGDVILVLDKIDDGWWKGQIDNRIGLFPTTYVKSFKE